MAEPTVTFRMPVLAVLAMPTCFAVIGQYWLASRVPDQRVPAPFGISADWQPAHPYNRRY